MLCAVREKNRRGAGRARRQPDMTDGGSQAARSRIRGLALARSEACTKAILAATVQGVSGRSRRTAKAAARSWSSVRDGLFRPRGSL